MADIFDYLSWRGDLDFNASPFNPVDNIIFSQLSYLALDGIVPGPGEKEGISLALAVKVYDERINSPERLKVTSIFKEDPDLIRTLGASKRFGNCHLFGYENHLDNDRELQFSALCIYTSDDHCFVAFRGTDSSVVGWKEDFNMCFKEVIPAQLEAVNYLEKMSRMINRPLRIGGHSKGGNLAIYAASHCSKNIQHRITDIYSNDAPGFHEKVIHSENFLAIKDRIHSYVPQSSIIGMLLEHGNESTVIKSNESGLSQHNLYSWEVTHDDLLRAEESTISSRFVNNTLREWIYNLDNEEREQFIDSLYHILSEADIKSFSDLENSWFSYAGRVFKSLSAVDESKRKLIRKTLKELFQSAGRNIDTFLKQ
ncbi:MAG: DUF2974 domain-containing protein [Treponema sp.]|nr:DUF2974 domain-containing protein [Treponema sp.]